MGYVIVYYLASLYFWAFPDILLLTYKLIPLFSENILHIFSILPYLLRLVWWPIQSQSWGIFCVPLKKKCIFGYCWVEFSLNDNWVSIGDVQIFYILNEFLLICFINYLKRNINHLNRNANSICVFLLTLLAIFATWILMCC